MPSKIHNIRLVKIQPEERLAATSELNLAFSLVTGYGEGNACRGNGLAGARWTGRDTSPIPRDWQEVSAKRWFITLRAREYPTCKVTSLAHLLTVDFLKIGHYQYYGISGNIQGLQSFYYHTVRFAFKWINRRNQKKSYNGSQFNRFLSFNPLPKPKIYHSYALSKRRLARDLPNSIKTKGVTS